jgi:hypothetical protein
MRFSESLDGPQDIVISGDKASGTVMNAVRQMGQVGFNIGRGGSGAAWKDQGSQLTYKVGQNCPVNTWKGRKVSCKFKNGIIR